MNDKTQILSLSGIKKDYPSGSGAVHALKGVDIAFGRREFVSVLGPSGCGKTTLLNIIGGLDRYTEGDLTIRGRSTKDFSDHDWDNYRNHSVGFVFQTYNLIPHQTVLENVELALTLSGINRTERRQKARQALEKVGLGDQLSKKPNQLSGGQMQRVAIARAIVNDPDIILADEPTGALDTETSVSVLEILKEISRTRLVIMVTHNPELAVKYSTRIVNLLDGSVVSDEPNGETAKEDAEDVSKDEGKQPSMSFFTALSLSFRNLLTKKGRTVLTSFAGSIGIIGIALILSLSNGIQNYINRVQEDTLSSYPLTVQENAMDMSGLMEAMSGGASRTKHELDAVYSDTSGAKLVNSMLSQIKHNDLVSFKEFLETDTELKKYVSSVQYGYNVQLNVYSKYEGKYIKINPSNLFEQIYGDMGSSVSQMTETYSSGATIWREMINDPGLLQEQYDIMAGRWPEKPNELILFINKNNEINDLVLYSMGVKDPSQISEIIKAAMAGKKVDSEQVRLTYDEILGMTYRLLPQTAYFGKLGDSELWTDMSGNEEFVNAAIESENAIELKFVGVARPAENTVAGSGAGSIGYTADLTKLVIDTINGSEIVKEQLADKTRSVFTGLPFSPGEITAEDIRAYIAALPDEQRVLVEMYVSKMNDEQLIAAALDSFAKTEGFNEVCGKLGVVDPAKPTSVNIYASTFEAKEKISDILNEYNELHAEDGKAVKYTDYVALLMSSVSTIVKFVSYALIVFVSISLVVSSIMIGIITYISVLERTKEIGILRSIGASKRDISRVFNAETLIVGFVSGVFGIVATLLLILPLNIIIRSLSGIAHIASLPAAGGIVLVVISMLLTLVAGLIPAGMAARKDPVTALRIE